MLGQTKSGSKDNSQVESCEKGEQDLKSPVEFRRAKKAASARAWSSFPIVFAIFKWPKISSLKRKRKVSQSKRMGSLARVLKRSADDPGDFVSQQKHYANAKMYKNESHWQSFRNFSIRSKDYAFMLSVLF